MNPLFLVLFFLPLERLSSLFQQEKGRSWGWILFLLLVVALLLLWWLLGPGARRRRRQMGDLPGGKKGSRPAPSAPLQNAAPAPRRPATPAPALSPAPARPAPPVADEPAPAPQKALSDDAAPPGEAAEPATPLPAEPAPTVAPDAPPPQPVALPSAPAPPVEPDNLRRIEGIGPKVAGILQANGIATFAQLADAGVERLQEILSAEGLKFIKPDTWPEQADLAAKGDWNGLEQLQSQLKGGRRIDG